MNTAIYVIMGLFGVFLFFSGIKDLWKLMKAKSYEGRADGEIVEVIENSSVSKGQRNYFYVPVYEFLANGQKIRKKADYNSSDRNKFKVNDKVVIKYNTSNPQEFQAEGSVGNVMGQGLLFFVLGGAFVGMAIYKMIGMYS